MADLILIAKSKNGIEVMFDVIGSHAATHLDDTPELRDLVIEIIESLVLDGQEINRDFDMGREVGLCDVVSVKAGDQIVYGFRKNRQDQGLVPFVKNKQGETSRFVSISLTPIDNYYVLNSAWIGTFDDEPFPLSIDANDKSVDYWNTHAFVYGSQEIIEGSETVIKPW